MQHNVGALTNLPYGDTGEDSGLEPLLSLDRYSFFPSLNMNLLFFSVGKNNQKLVYVASINIHLTTLFMDGPQLYNKKTSLKLILNFKCNIYFLKLILSA